MPRHSTDCQISNFAGNIYNKYFIPYEIKTFRLDRNSYSPLYFRPQTPNIKIFVEL